MAAEDEEDGEPLHSELFEVCGDDAAAAHARRLIRPHISDPRAQYGLLYVVDGPRAGAFIQCSYLTDVEVD